MRRALSFTMVLLLVLRGLLGDAMAMGATPVTPAVGMAVASTHAVPHQHAAAQPASPDEEHAATGCNGAGSTDLDSHCFEHEHEHGTGCSACGICHSALFTPSQPASLQGLAPDFLRPQGHSVFASAAARQIIKPPIS
ncbi:hypothetical protein [Comamonas composti]|uniref:hypothetical protein n=1 Tax=Comamonas composti TaxID=408558 RepID=UPI00040286F3|nr:hypothetical protein [Comamonas composti]